MVTAVSMTATISRSRSERDAVKEASPGHPGVG